MTEAAAQTRTTLQSLRDRIPSALFWLLIAATAALIIYPLGIMLWRTFVPDTGFSFEVLQSATRLPLGSLVLNTALLAVASSILALVLGGTFAWLNEVTDARLGILSEIVPLTSLFVPHLAAVAGWVVLFEPRIGYVNVAARELFNLQGRSGPLDIYTLPGMIFVTTLFLIPYSYLMISAGLRNLDPSLEEASRLSGAGIFSTLWKVTLPSVMPSILDAFILMLITGMTIFSVPIVIGSRAGIDVMATSIYGFIVRYPPQYDAAIVLSIGTLILVEILLVLRHQLLKRMQRATISGKGFRRSVVRLGRFKWIGKSVGVLYIFMVGVLPVVALVLVALQPFWSGSINWQTIGIQNFEAVFKLPATSEALLNSFLLGVISAFALLLLVGILVALSRYGAGGNEHVIDALANLPATVPHIVIAVAFLFAFAGSPFFLQGTIVLLVLAYSVQYMPYAVRNVQAAMADIGEELPAASRIFGAGLFSTLRRVVLPLAIPGLTAGWIIVFSHVYSEVTVSSLLSAVNNITVGRLLIDFLESGSFPRLAAVALMMTLVTAVPVLILMTVSRRKFASRI